MYYLGDVMLFVNIVPHEGFPRPTVILKIKYPVAEPVSLGEPVAARVSFPFS